MQPDGPVVRGQSTSTPSTTWGVGRAVSPVRLLVSFPEPRPTTNPYITMLNRALTDQPGLSVQNFSFRTALLGHYDVFHVHWPEILGSGHGTVKTLARQGLTAAFLARLALTGTPVVRTVHNLDRPSGLSRRQRWLLDGLDRRTTLRIRLNDVTTLPGHAQADGTPRAPTDGAQPGWCTIVHGHYRDWFADHPRAEAVPGRVVAFGLVRRYKGLEDLVTTFGALLQDPGQTGSPSPSLHVAGQPSTPQLAQALTALADGSAAITFDFRFLDDAALVRTVTSAQLVVLPYRFMHNSGAVLTALSLDRPVLVPGTEVNRRLAAEVGPGWVLTYDGPLTPQVLRHALEQTAAPRPGQRPDLSARDWTDTGARHAQAYRQTLDTRRGGEAS